MGVSTFFKFVWVLVRTHRSVLKAFSRQRSAVTTSKWIKGGGSRRPGFEVKKGNESLLVTSGKSLEECSFYIATNVLICRSQRDVRLRLWREKLWPSIGPLVHPTNRKKNA
jgi:hypothetical protein